MYVASSPTSVLQSSGCVGIDVVAVVGFAIVGRIGAGVPELEEGASELAAVGTLVDRVSAVGASELVDGESVVGVVGVFVGSLVVPSEVG